MAENTTTIENGKVTAPLLKVGNVVGSKQVTTPVTQTTTDNDEFVFNPEIGNEKPIVEKGKAGDEKPATTDKTFNYARFKDIVGKEEFGEDELYSAFDTKLKAKETEANTYKNNLAIVKEGKERLKSDKQYQDWKNFLRETPENLVTASLAYQFAEDGLSPQEAMTKAKERVKEESERNKYYVEDTARQIRAGLNNSISERETQIQSEIENASKDISFINTSEDFESKVKEAGTKFDNFLGMKLSKDDKERVKLVNQSYISPKEMNELLKDPDTYNEISFYLKNKKALKANIESRTNGKSKMLDKLPKTPSVGAGLTIKTQPQNGSTPKAFDGKGFLGR